jgi:hypothetical protein
MKKLIILGVLMFIGCETDSPKTFSFNSPQKVNIIKRGRTDVIVSTLKVKSYTIQEMVGGCNKFDFVKEDGSHVNFEGWYYVVPTD